MTSIFLGCFWNFCCDGWTRWSHYQFGMDQATDLLDFGLEISAISGELSFQFSISLFLWVKHLIPLANLSSQLLDWIYTHKRLCISKQALHSIGLWIWVCLQGDGSSWWACGTGIHVQLCILYFSLPFESVLDCWWLNWIRWQMLQWRKWNSCWNISTFGELWPPHSGTIMLSDNSHSHC
jgi:hypothetical protein